MKHPPPFPPPAEPTRRPASGATATVLGLVAATAVVIGLAGLGYAFGPDSGSNRAATPLADIAGGAGTTVAAGAFAVAVLCGILAWRSRTPSDW